MHHAYFFSLILQLVEYTTNVLHMREHFAHIFLNRMCLSLAQRLLPLILALRAVSAICWPGVRLRARGSKNRLKMYNLGKRFKGLC